MALQFYNTLSRKKENFIPLSDGEVLLYTCGPTIYNHIHIGNLRTFLFEDILVRYLRYKGYKVRQIMNLTDVDDKTIKNSIKEGKSLKDYTNKYKQSFFHDINLLNITPAESYPAATDHIEDMVRLIQKLSQNGYTYEIAGSTYFSINKFKDYGKLAHLDKSSLRAGAGGRVSSDEYDKENVSDFVLWKAHTKDDGDVYWNTPIGKGRPGWHIECSGMSMRYLGETFDIHTGGVDNIFPHHENEIAQSEGATAKKFVNYWMHSEFLNLKGEKSSKSKGNVIYLKDLLDKGFSKEAIRFSLIQSHYRSKINYGDDILDQAKSTLAGINYFIQRCLQINKTTHNCEKVMDIISTGLSKFENAMDDDLNISLALAGVFEVIKNLNLNFDSLSKNDITRIIDFFRKINEVLGVLSFERPILDEEINRLIKERNTARQKKDYITADTIRDRLKESGILLEDTPKGVIWKKV